MSRTQIKRYKPRVRSHPSPCVGASCLPVSTGAKPLPLITLSVCPPRSLPRSPFCYNTHATQTPRVGSSEDGHVTEAVCMATTTYHPVNCLFTGCAHKNRRTGTVKHHFTHTIQTHSHRHRGTDGQSQDRMTAPFQKTERGCWVFLFFYFFFCFDCFLCMTDLFNLPFCFHVNPNTSRDTSY